MKMLKHYCKQQQLATICKVSAFSQTYIIPYKFRPVNNKAGLSQRCNDIIISHTHARMHARTRTHAHTHTHTFNRPFSRTTQVSQYQKGKIYLDFTEGFAENNFCGCQLHL